jgi:serine/threonine protein kinase
MFAAGTLLGTYEITGLLGSGGMGEVYRGRDTRLDRPVALKVLPAALAADPRFRQRFDREARVISRLNHPQICTVYDIGDAQGVCFSSWSWSKGRRCAPGEAGHGPGRSPTS